MSDIVAQIWFPLAVSGASLAALLYTLWEGLRLADAVGKQAHSRTELRVARAARLGGILFLLAISLWAAYLRYGPFQDFANQIVGD